MNNTHPTKNHMRDDHMDGQKPHGWPETTCVTITWMTRNQTITDSW
jgi:hypothetical protein